MNPENIKAQKSSFMTMMYEMADKRNNHLCISCFKSDQLQKRADGDKKEKIRGTEFFMLVMKDEIEAAMKTSKV